MHQKPQFSETESWIFGIKEVKMKDIKPIIAKNLSFFRKQSGITQLELAEKLNYSDKAISRWENGDTLPDINVLYQLCDFYGIDMNTLISEDADIIPEQEPELKNSVRYRVGIFGLAVSAVWILATIAFMYSALLSGGESYYWMSFIWAMPLSCIAIIICLHGLKLRVMRLVINSILIWTTLTGIFLTLLLEGYALWSLYLVGVPVQIIVVMVFLIRKGK